MGIQPRDHRIQCAWCPRMTLAISGVCRSKQCRAREARAKIRFAQRLADYEARRSSTVGERAGLVAGARSSASPTPTGVHAEDRDAIDAISAEGGLALPVEASSWRSPSADPSEVNA